MTTSLPPSSDFTASTVTEGGFKAAITASRAFLAGLLGTDGKVATALRTLGALGSHHLAKSGAYTVSLDDRGAVIDMTGTWSLGLPAVEAAEAGFSVALRNGGTGTVTLTPAGSDQIEGAGSLAFGPGRSAVLICTGTAWMLAEPRRQSGPADASPGRLLSVGASATVLSASPALRASVGGSANVLSLTTGAALSALPTGLLLRFRATAPNTGATRIDVDGLGAVACKTVTGAALPAGYIRTDVDTWAAYDGTSWVLDRAPERGALVNGRFTRLADGTLICSHEMELPFATAAKCEGTWIYPAMFATGSNPITTGATSGVGTDPSTHTRNATPGAAEICPGVAVGAGGTESIQVAVFRQNNETNFQVVDRVRVTLTAHGDWY